MNPDDITDRLDIDNRENIGRALRLKGSDLGNSFSELIVYEYDQQWSDDSIGVVIILMSIVAITSNIVVIKNSRRTKIFGRFFGFLLVYRGFFESSNAFIALTFFASYIFLAYEVSAFVNITLSTLFIFNLTILYMLHLIISSNRCLAVFRPLQYDDIFEKKRSIWICIGIVVSAALIITSTTFYYPCSQFVFSRYRYDFLPVGCTQKNGYSLAVTKELLFGIVVAWGVITFLALAVDLMTLVKLIVVSRKTTGDSRDRNSATFYRNVRVFLQTFFLNMVVCAGVIATHVVSEHFVNSFERFWFVHFQVLLGFALNGVTPLIVHRELRSRSRTTVVANARQNTSR
ncbi:hypothetical protein QR680_018760 [Steinernema hermaphroditum]|uniref:G-protein coupled receptors family 1 profile domain-containing protein n=1 Tax=Steinernema hermaphroditum TaxID=289476 RepID=A0AA39HL95_9BILA|nr:hypothetical protein QR680_018760 [Steinernema hermaphroditum]